MESMEQPQPQPEEQEQKQEKTQELVWHGADWLEGEDSVRRLYGPGIVVLNAQGQVKEVRPLPLPTTPQTSLQGNEAQGSEVEASANLPKAQAPSEPVSAPKEPEAQPTSPPEA